MMSVKVQLRESLRGNTVTARLTLIAHAATEAQRHAAFPLDEPVTEREITRISALRGSAPRADQIWSAPELRAQQTSHVLGRRQRLQTHCVTVTTGGGAAGRWMKCR